MLVFLIVFTHFAHCSWTYIEKQVYSQYLLASIIVVIIFQRVVSNVVLKNKGFVEDSM
jgi:hypothetical protein